MRAAVQALDVQADLGRAQLLPAVSRFTAGVAAGLSYALGDSADLRFAVGANYIAAQHEKSAALAGLGINQAQLTGQRWSIPAEIGVTYRF